MLTEGQVGWLLGFKQTNPSNCGWGVTGFWAGVGGCVLSIGGA